jgi:hypothetical protein
MAWCQMAIWLPFFSTSSILTCDLMYSGKHARLQRWAGLLSAYNLLVLELFCSLTNTPATPCVDIDGRGVSIPSACGCRSSSERTPSHLTRTDTHAGNKHLVSLPLGLWQCGGYLSSTGASERVTWIKQCGDSVLGRHARPKGAEV